MNPTDEAALYADIPAKGEAPPANAYHERRQRMRAERVAEEEARQQAILKRLRWAAPGGRSRADLERLMGWTPGSVLAVLLQLRADDLAHEVEGVWFAGAGERVAPVVQESEDVAGKLLRCAERSPSRWWTRMQLAAESGCRASAAQVGRVIDQLVADGKLEGVNGGVTSPRTPSGVAGRGESPPVGRPASVEPTGSVGGERASSPDPGAAAGRELLAEGERVSGVDGDGGRGPDQAGSVVPAHPTLDATAAPAAPPNRTEDPEPRSSAAVEVVTGGGVETSAAPSGKEDEHHALIQDEVPSPPDASDGQLREATVVGDVRPPSSDSFRAEIAADLRRLFAASGLTATELGKRTGLHPKTVKRSLDGTTCDPSTADRIRAALVRAALPDAPQGDPTPRQEASRAREVAELDSEPDPSEAEWGAWVRARRLELGLTQVALARQAGWASSTLSIAERGRILRTRTLAADRFARFQFDVEAVIGPYTRGAQPHHEPSAPATATGSETEPAAQPAAEEREGGVSPAAPAADPDGPDLPSCAMQEPAAAGVDDSALGELSPAGRREDGPEAGSAPVTGSVSQSVLPAPEVRRSAGVAGQDGAGAGGFGQQLLREFNEMYDRKARQFAELFDRAVAAESRMVELVEQAEAAERHVALLAADLQEVEESLSRLGVPAVGELAWRLGWLEGRWGRG